MSIKKLILVLFIFLSLSSFSQTVKIENYSYFDTDKNIIQKNMIGYNHDLNNNINIGVMYGFHNIKNLNNIMYNRMGTRLLYDNENLFSMNIQYLFNNHYDNQISYKLNYFFNDLNMFKINMFSERDIIDGTKAIQQGFTYMVNGATTDILLSENYTFSLTIGYANQQLQNLKNNVYRDIYIFNSNLLLFNNIGINLTNKLMYSNNNSIYYFQPNIFNKHLLGINKKFILNDDNIVVKFFLYGGLQNFNGNYQNIYVGRLIFRGWINDKFGFKFDSRYSNAIYDFGDYNFFMGNVSIEYKFN